MKDQKLWHNKIKQFLFEKSGIWKFSPLSKIVRFCINSKYTYSMWLPPIGTIFILNLNTSVFMIISKNNSRRICKAIQGHPQVMVLNTTACFSWNNFRAFFKKEDFSGAIEKVGLVTRLLHSSIFGFRSKWHRH